MATGTIEDVVSGRGSGRERVLLGDRDYAGETLFIETDSGTDGGVGDASFGEGDLYKLYLQRKGDAWKTNA